MALAFVPGSAEIVERLRTRRSARPRPPDRNLSATRHLSAGAYLDPEFCLRVLHEVYFRTKRLVAPSHGYDALTVLGHCLRARRSMAVRDALLVALFMAMSWVSLIATLTTLVALLAVHFGQISERVLREAFQYIVEGGYFRDAVAAERAARSGAGGHVRRQDSTEQSASSRLFSPAFLPSVTRQIIARGLRMLGAYLTLVIVAVLLATQLWHTHPLSATRLGISPRWAILGSIAGAFLVPAAVRGWNRIQLYGLKPGGRPKRLPRNRRLAEIEGQLSGNTVIYSGYQHFVGAGEVLHSWGMAQRLVQAPPRGTRALTETETEGAREFEQPPFTAMQLANHVRGYIAELTNNVLPEWRLANLTVRDRIFVAGTEIDYLWADTSLHDVKRIIQHPTAPQRHYLECQVVSWNGKLVTTVYVHFAVQGKALYVELKVLGLTPCAERFRIIDQVGGVSVWRLLQDAGRAALDAPVLFVAAPRGLLHTAANTVTLAVAARSANGRVRKGYDYGARTSIREMGATELPSDPIQTQDIVKYGRVVERRVVAAILDFLEDRGVDVTEYRQSAQSILSIGAVATNGGTVAVSGDAAGVQTNG
jgi:hypothetical protein